jgi:hypothetical protein
MDGLSQGIQRDPILVRDAEHVGNHVGRHQTGYVGDQVAGADTGHAVDDARGQLLDTRTHGFGDSGDELRCHDLAERGVPGPVGHEHHLMIAEVECLRVRDHDRRSRRECGRIAADGLDVAVAGDCPKPLGTRFWMPVHGIIRPEPGELVMGLAVTE